MMPADFFKVNMNNNKKRKMVALKVLETSGVDHPAHLEEGWIVMKSANATEAPVSEEVEAMDEALDQAYIERVVELEKAVQERDEKIASLAKEYGEMMAEEEEDEEEMDEEETMKSVLKSLPEPVREMFEKAQGEAAVAREELRK